MSRPTAALLVLAVAGTYGARGAAVTPVAKAIELMASLTSKVIKEGVASQSVYDEYAEWCEDRAKNLKFEIKTGKTEVAALQATIDKATASITVLGSKIEGLVGEIAKADADLKAAISIREKEEADFLAEEKELADVISMIERAIAILERDMAKSPALLQAQLNQAGGVEEALDALVRASVFSMAGAHRIKAALLQGKAQTKFRDAMSEREDADAAAMEPGAPAAAAYKSHSDGVVQVLEDLLETAEGELDDARKEEAKSENDYQMLKQSLEDDIKYDTEDLDKAKKSLAEDTEIKATAEGDLAVTSKDLAEDIKVMSTLHADCSTKASNFEEEVKSRDEEIKALGEAKQALVNMGEGAAKVAYSLLELVHPSQRLAGAAQAVAFVQDLAKKMGSKPIALLASRMNSAFKLGAAGGYDPFAKVNELIKELIDRLIKEGQAEASHKAYCDKEFKAAYASKADKEAEIAKLTVRIDLAATRSAKLKEEVAALQEELSELAASQVKMDSVRAKEHALFKTSKADTEAGLEGVKIAIKVLKDYYGSPDAGHEKATGEGTSIIGLLEVIESDFSQSLAKLIADEAAAAGDHEAQTKENEVTRATKTQDAKYKTEEYTRLDKAAAEMGSDRASVQEELDAILDGLEKLKVMCAPKFESYDERQARRAQEIAGLKEALIILEGMAFFQQASAGRRPNLRAHA